MSGYTDIATEPERRRFHLSPGLVVLLLFVALVIVIAISLLVNARAGDATPGNVTIAQLQADPERYDNHSVILLGSAEDVHELPYLTQSAVYTFRDATGTIRVLTQKGS